MAAATPRERARKRVSSLRPRPNPTGGHNDLKLPTRDVRLIVRRQQPPGVRKTSPTTSDLKHC